MKTDNFSITEVDEHVENIMTDLKKTVAQKLKNKLLILISIVNIFWTGTLLFLALVAIVIILEVYHAIFHPCVDQARLTQSIAKKEMFTVVQKLFGMNSSDRSIYKDAKQLTESTIKIDRMNQIIVEKGIMAANVSGCSHFFSEFLIFAAKSFILWFLEYLIENEYMEVYTLIIFLLYMFFLYTNYQELTSKTFSDYN